MSASLVTAVHALVTFRLAARPCRLRSGSNQGRLLRHTRRGSPISCHRLTVPILAATLLQLSGSPLAADGEPTFILSFGGPGTTLGRFAFPHGIAYSPVNHRVYVADTGNHRVQWFEPNGTFVGAWGGHGLLPGLFVAPNDLAIDGDGNVYVASDDRIQKFTADGQYLDGWGGHGTGEGQFQYAMDVAVDVLGAVYATDWMNYRVQKFTADGVFVAQWGSAGAGPGQFGGVITVASGPDGRVYVADAANGRVQVFTPDGGFLLSFGATGVKPGEIDFPNSPAVDGEHVFVADVGNHQVDVFGTDGAFEMQWGSFGFGPGQFNRPLSVALAPDGSIYVVDKDNHRVQKFAQFSTPAIPTTLGSVKLRYR